MYKYAIKRILLTIPVLLGVVFIVFSILSLTPGDPASEILGVTASVQARASLNHSLGYDLPFFTRFFNYLKNIILHFDFGISYTTKKPVVIELMKRFPVTVKLAAFSIILSTIIGVSLGVLSAIKQYSVLDTTCTVMAMFFSAVPYFWLGMMFMLLFSLKLGWLPTNGIDSVKGYILPVSICTIGGIGGMLRLTRSTMLETIRQDYIRTARAKGAPERIVIWRHALKNGLLPVITIIGANFGSLLGGAVVIETIFALPGVGTYILTAIRQKNVPVVLSGTLILAALFCVIMLIVDLLYAFIDPRIKARYTK
jgi:peptide/nickel transport system permease protein